MKKILITGASGQLGGSLHHFLKNIYSVIPTTKEIIKDNQLNSRLLKLDISKKNEVVNILKKFNPDIVINCAAYSDVDGNEKNKNLAYKVNVEGLKHIIQYTSKDTYIIQISSDYVFDGNSGPYSECDSTFPINYYGKTKLEAENLLRGSIKKWVIIRPNVIYGEDIFCKANFFGWIYRNLINNKKINIVDDQISNPIYIEQICKIIFQCIIMKYEGILHVGSDNYISRLDFAYQVAEVFLFDKALITSISTKELSEKNSSYIAKRPMDSSLNITKVENEINISMVSTLFSLQKIKQNLC